MGLGFASHYNPYAQPGHASDYQTKLINSVAGPSESDEERRRRMLAEQAGAAGNFANTGETGYGQLSWEARMERDRLRRLAQGEDSLSAEQLRQGLQRNLSTQRALAASAPAGSQPMAARTAAMNAMRLGSGLAGQQALAGIQERNAAANALSNAITAQRGQDINVALGSRGTAIQGYGAQNAGPPEKGFWDYALPVATGAITAMSDERLKEDIRNADDDADGAIRKLGAYRFKYKDEKYGKGSQFGIMAQDLERAGLDHAVIETPAGKAVDGAKLSTSNTAMIARLGHRLAALEEKKK